MQKSLKRIGSPVANKPKPPDKKPQVNVNTAGLTIQQRIALMKGQNVGGVEVLGSHSHHSESQPMPTPSSSHSRANAPSNPVKPKIPPKKASPQTPLKPPSVASLSAPDSARRYPGYDMVTIRKEPHGMSSPSSGSMVTSSIKIVLHYAICGLHGTQACDPFSLVNVTYMHLAKMLPLSLFSQFLFDRHVILVSVQIMSLFLLLNCQALAIYQCYHILVVFLSVQI